MMNKIQISSNESQALDELKHRLSERFGIEKLVLYGSVARGQADMESDIDLLVLTSQPLTRFERHKITNVVFDVNLSYDTNFSTLVLDLNSWEKGIFSILPIYDEIARDEILL